MPAPKNNDFWKLRAKHGRGKDFETPEELKAACYEYFEACTKNPLYKSEYVRGEGLVQVPIIRPFKCESLYNYLGIVTTTWTNYTNREDFVEVTTHVEQIIYSQKFEGAAVGIFNANIIARDLGLADKVDAKNNNHNYNSAPLTPEEIKEIDKTLESKY